MSNARTRPTFFLGRWFLVAWLFACGRSGAIPTGPHYCSMRPEQWLVTFGGYQTVYEQPEGPEAPGTGTDHVSPVPHGSSLHRDSDTNWRHHLPITKWPSMFSSFFFHRQFPLWSPEKVKYPFFLQLTCAALLLAITAVLSYTGRGGTRLGVR